MPVVRVRLAAVPALIPMTLCRPAASLAYIAGFSLGVLVVMMGFGLALDRIQGAPPRPLLHGDCFPQPAF